MYLRRGRLIAEMQFLRCLYLCFGFVCVLTSCGLKISRNFSSEQGHKWRGFRRKQPWKCRAQGWAFKHLHLEESVHLNCSLPFCLSQRRKWQPLPVFLPGEFHAQRSLAGYSPWGLKESDTTEQLSLTLSLSIILAACGLLTGNQIINLKMGQQILWPIFKH